MNINFTTEGAKPLVTKLKTATDGDDTGNKTVRSMRVAGDVAATLNTQNLTLNGVAIAPRDIILQIGTARRTRNVGVTDLPALAALVQAQATNIAVDQEAVDTAALAALATGTKAHDEFTVENSETVVAEMSKLTREAQVQVMAELDA
jgi:hypothetical protein